MPALSPILSILLFTTGAALGAYWTIVLYHIARTMARVPTLPAGLRLPVAPDLLKPSAPKVCIVVPAHNEQGVVGHLAASLLKQTYPNLSILFCLDRCTDGTAHDIRQATGGADHAELIEITSCPPEWAGKVHAVWTGVSTSRAAQEADILLFTDADTTFHPECVRAAVALLRSRDLGMLSLMSTLTSDRWFERIAQPAAGIELMRQYPLVRANAREHRRAFANGQFMMFTRAAYDHIGGHLSVRDAVLEDVELARLAERRAVPGGLFLADGMLHCRMYSSYDEFVKGWKRIYIESANRRIKRLTTIALRGQLVGALLPTLVVLLIALNATLGLEDPTRRLALAVGAASLAVTALALAWSYRLSRVPIWCILFYPLGAWQVASILREAARDLVNRVPVRWAGREYIREPR